MKLVLEVVTDSLRRQSSRVYPSFEPDARFDPVWWLDGSAKNPVSYCRFLDDHVEVGRAKILPGSRSYAGYQTLVLPACRGHGDRPQSRSVPTSAGPESTITGWP